MEKINRKLHWEKIYSEKNFSELSWYQKRPVASLNFIKKFKLSKNSKIIDIGGGDSFFVDSLLDLGYKDITVLDISETSLIKAQNRLGKERSKYIKWINADVAKFKPDEKYDLWHDRAAFHFLTDEPDIKKYIKTVKDHVKPEGYLLIGTFSEKGPEKCSGLKIKRYSENTMSERLINFFNKIKCITVNHKTPFNTIQNFIFCSFQRLSSV